MSMLPLLLSDQSVYYYMHYSQIYTHQLFIYVLIKSYPINIDVKITPNDYLLLKTSTFRKVSKNSFFIAWGGLVKASYNFTLKTLYNAAGGVVYKQNNTNTSFGKTNEIFKITGKIPSAKARYIIANRVRVDRDF